MWYLRNLFLVFNFFFLGFNGYQWIHVRTRPIERQPSGTRTKTTRNECSNVLMFLCVNVVRAVQQCFLGIGGWKKNLGWFMDELSHLQSMDLCCRRCKTSGCVMPPITFPCEWLWKSPACHLILSYSIYLPTADLSLIYCLIAIAIFCVSNLQTILESCPAARRCFLQGANITTLDTPAPRAWESR
jgi:hypothetical protein